MKNILIFEPTYFNHSLTIITFVIALIFFFISYKIFNKSLVFTNDLYNISIVKYFIVFMGVIVLLLPEPNIYLEVKKKLANKKYYIIEGKISHFKEGRSNRGKYNSFNIDGIHFVYDDFTVNSYYHKVAKSGSLINRNGQIIKIFYLKTFKGNKIIKMWIKGIGVNSRGQSQWR
jgi:hypothetical protein